MGLVWAAVETGELDINLRKPANEIVAAENTEESIRLLVADLQEHHNLTPTILYDSARRREQEFKPGSDELLTAALTDLQIVDESQLSWDQVLEFRKDREARIKYRRLTRWIDTEIKERSPAEVQYLIALKLDDYEWAIKKHGLKASLGTLSCLIDPEFIAGVSAAVAGTAVAAGSLWSALAGASLIFGKVIASFGSAAVDSADERRGENYEIAYVHEIKGKLG